MGLDTCALKAELQRVIAATPEEERYTALLTYMRLVNPVGQFDGAISALANLLKVSKSQGEAFGVS